MKKIFLLSGLLFCSLILFAQKPASPSGRDSTLKKKDRKRDVLLQTSMGDIVIRLSDSTPLHKDNFLKLVKVGFYDSLLFHRVMKDFMIQAGDPNSKTAAAGIQLGNGGPNYTIPAEFRASFFHKKGVVAAARQPDYVNPQKASSGSQFYIVQGKKFTDSELDIFESGQMQGRKIPVNQRETYKTAGGTPHLDGSYTVFGEVIKGLEVVDKIAVVKTSMSPSPNRPLEDVRIIKAKLIKKKKYKTK